MTSCGLEQCADPNCLMCVDLPRRFPRRRPCARTVGAKEEACRFVAGHPGACRTRDSGRPKGETKGAALRGGTK